MTYSYLKPRLAKLIPELANNETALRLALPAAIGGATGLGALAYNAVAPLDIDPVGLAVGTGLSLGTQGRTPYNYAGIAALGLEGARYLNNAFTNGRDTDPSPLIAMGIGASALGVREGLRRGWIRPEDVGFPVRRMAQDLGKPSATTPIENVVAAPPRKPPPNPTKPTPSPRVAVDSNSAEIHPLHKESNQVFEDAINNTNTVLGRTATEADVAPDELVVPAPTIEDYIIKSPLLNKDRARQYADPNHPNYQPDFVKMMTQELSDDFRAELAFPDDVLANHFKGSGVPSPVATGAIHLPILNGSFGYPTQKGKLNSDVIVFRGSNLIGGEGKSNLVNQGIVPEGTYYPNAVTSNPQSLLRMAQGVIPSLQDPGYYIGKNQVLTPPPTSVAREQYINLTNSGRMATPMGYKNLSEPQLYVDELSGGSSPYDINDFYGLRSAKKRTTDKVTGTKYYRGVMD